MFLFRNIIKTKPLRLCLFTLTLNVIFPRVIYVSKRSLFLTFPQQISACTKVSQIFQKSGSHLKILRVRCVTKSNFPTEGPQILGATVRKIWLQRAESSNKLSAFQNRIIYFIIMGVLSSLRILVHVYRQHFFMGFSIARS